MPLFLTQEERNAVSAQRKTGPYNSFYWALINRTEKRAAAPGLGNLSTSCEWWHFVAEYLTDAAMVHALKPSPSLSAWICEVTLAVARRPIDDWVGPDFRDHNATPPVGHLETAHLSWSVAVALDLAADCFAADEREEITQTLREKGIALCQRWLDKSQHIANWRCVLNSGVAVAAAVINDTESMARAAGEFRRCADAFQPDGSYAESLQYSNYAGYTLMLAREALIRRDPSMADQLPLDPWVNKPRWDAASLFYLKPLAGWGAHPRPRSANFNDSAAINRPSADFLLHLAARAHESHPQEAGLARWLFDTFYTPCTNLGPDDRATFGFINDFGFLTIPLLLRAAPAITPKEAGLTELETFSCGDVLVRDRWDDEGRTVIAIHGPGESLHGPGHLHGDINSFILVHNRERLLLDPGHSCYRNLIHDLEGSTLTHNTCTFELQSSANAGPKLQEEQFRSGILQQSRSARRHIDPVSRKSLPPVHRGGQRLLATRLDDVTAIAAEAAALYGAPITRFARFWFLCGSNVLFVVDHIKSEAPVKTSWSWLLNNRDNELELKIVRPDRFIARRGNAGMKAFNLSGGSLIGPTHAYVHDAYHPLPNQHGEGQPGSGVLLRWTEKSATTSRTAAHAFAFDDYGASAGWHLKTGDKGPILESPGATAAWQLQSADDGSRFIISETVSGRSYTITTDASGLWQLTRKQGKA